MVESAGFALASAGLVAVVQVLDGRDIVAQLAVAHTVAELDIAGEADAGGSVVAASDLGKVVVVQQSLGSMIELVARS